MKIAAAGAGLLLILGLAPARAADPAPPPPSQNDSFGATLWMQTSAEYKAVSLGAFALARLRLDEALADPSWSAASEQTGDYAEFPPAIIVDVDETVLDNSAYMAWSTTSSTPFSLDTWDAFVKDEVSVALPGALDFTAYAASKGVTVFYVTNRIAGEKEATRENLAKAGFPMGGNVETVFTKDEAMGWGSAKGSRRAHIAEDYRILLLMGDNFGDFTDAYKGTPEARLKVFEAAEDHWGHDWIVLPNPAYGSWEQAPFEGDYALPAAARRQMQVDALKPWQPKTP
ncbi:MAG: 5-nucleotide phosphatase [Parvibaculum sp.]|nr:5-nucleotide phosphatase [Parvibaculum sp.]